MTLSKREKILIAVLLLTAIVYLSNKYLYQPLGMKKLDLSLENRQISIRLQENEVKLNKYRNDDQDESEMQNNLQRLEKEIPSLPMIPDIIEYLELKAQEENIKLQSINYKPSNLSRGSAPVKETAQADPQIQSLEMQVIINGTCSNLLAFLIDIETAPRIFIIDSTKMSLTKPNITNQTNYASQPENFESIRNILPEEAMVSSSDNAMLSIAFKAYYDPFQ